MVNASELFMSTDSDTDFRNQVMNSCHYYSMTLALSHGNPRGSNIFLYLQKGPPTMLNQQEDIHVVTQDNRRIGLELDVSHSLEFVDKLYPRRDKCNSHVCTLSLNSDHYCIMLVSLSVCTCAMVYIILCIIFQREFLVRLTLVLYW